MRFMLMCWGYCAIDSCGLTAASGDKLWELIDLSTILELMANFTLPAKWLLLSLLSTTLPCVLARTLDTDLGDLGEWGDKLAVLLLNAESEESHRTDNGSSVTDCDSLIRLADGWSEPFILEVSILGDDVFRGRLLELFVDAFCEGDDARPGEAVFRGGTVSTFAMCTMFSALRPSFNSGLIDTVALGALGTYPGRSTDAVALACCRAFVMSMTLFLRGEKIVVGSTTFVTSSSASATSSGDAGLLASSELTTEWSWWRFGSAYSSEFVGLEGLSGRTKLGFSCSSRKRSM